MTSTRNPKMKCGIIALARWMGVLTANVYRHDHVANGQTDGAGHLLGRKDGAGNGGTQWGKSKVHHSGLVEMIRARTVILLQLGLTVETPNR